MQNFLFGPYPLALENIDKVFFIDSAFALAVALILSLTLFFKKVNPVNHKLVSRFKNLGWFYGLSGLIWTGFRFEGAAYLEWRLWFILIAAVSAVWLIKIIVYLVRDYKKELNEFRHQEVKQKYLSSRNT